MNFQSPTQIPTEYPVATPYAFTAVAPPWFHGRPGSSISTGCRPEGPSKVDHYPHRRISKDACRLCRCQLITFNMLPDDVLLEIFDFYGHEDVDGYIKQSIEKWIRLAHVCRRWRSVVFQSPLRLNLRLVCTPQTPTRNFLDIWPPLPLIIRDFDDHIIHPFIEDNIIAALEHNDRVCKIQLTNPGLEYFTNSAAILKPFPELTFLQLGGVFRPLRKEPGPMLPDSFLGGSAPRLRLLELYRVPFPALPKLLLSLTQLVRLYLSSIPRSGYFPPEAMAASLFALTALEFISLQFDCPPPRPLLETRRQPPPRTRSILPSLTKIRFKGASEYLEVILARIDAPLLDQLDITFFNQLIFNTPQLFQFISRRPMLRVPEKGHINFFTKAVSVEFPSQTSNYNVLTVQILSTPPEWQLSSLEQVCTSFLPPISTLEDLYISEGQQYPRPNWQGDVENTLWPDLLRPFAAVKSLYISELFVPRITPALQELVGGRTTEVLPALENLFLEGFQPSRPLHEGIEKFFAARSLTGHPVAISHWDRQGGIATALVIHDR